MLQVMLRVWMQNCACACMATVLATPLLVVAQSTTENAASSTAPVIHAQANLVVVDVVVTDGHNKPVEHLNTGDFTILEDGHPQTVKVFEEHLPQTATQPTPKLAPGSFSNRSAASDGGALNVLVLDKLNTPVADQMFLHNQLLKFLKTAQPGQRIAIFGLTTRLYMFQGFSSDPNLLRTVLESKKGLPGNSPLLGEQEGSDNLYMQAAKDAFGDSPNAAELIAELQQFDAEQQSSQQQLRVHYTLDALNQLARYLANLPGRKNVLWFSGAFPLSILPDGDLKNPFSAVADSTDEFRATVNMLTRSQVAVYPIDARGLMTAPMMSASNSGRSYATDPTAFARDNLKFMARIAGEHTTMQQMAEATGGMAFVNTNGLKEAAETALTLGAHYYTLAYSPTRTDWKGEYRHIHVKLDRPGDTLSYRRGYYADNPEAPQTRASSSNTSAPVYNPVGAALLHGAPTPTEILFDADVRPFSDATEPAVATGNQLSPKTKGPFRRYQVTFQVDPSGITCTEAAGGAHLCRFEFASSVYNADGELLNQQSTGIQATIPADKFRSMMATRLGFHQQISVPTKGEYFLRLGVFNSTSGHLGALELPVEAVAKLTPASASTPR